MKHTLTTASIFAIAFSTFLTSPSLAEETGEGELSWDTQATDDYTTIAGHASRSVTSNPESEDTGSGSSGDGVTTQYEDNSTWDEQPHQECSTEKDEYGLDKYKCNLATLHRPTQPDQPTTGGGPRTVTITTRQAATLIAQGSGITRQPPGPKVIISKAFIVYTNPAMRYQTTTILNTTIEVEFTPTTYTWNWGDGTTTTTTLTTTWTTRYRPAGENQWRPIEGTITTTETSTPYDLVRIVTYLTDDAEEAQGH